MSPSGAPECLAIGQGQLANQAKPHRSKPQRNLASLAAPPPRQSQHLRRPARQPWARIQTASKQTARRHGHGTPHTNPILTSPHALASPGRRPLATNRPGAPRAPSSGTDQAPPANIRQRVIEGFAPLIRPSVTTWPDSQSLADACQQPDFSVKTCSSTLDKRLSNPRFPLRSKGPEQAAEPCAQKWSTERNLLVFQWVKSAAQRLITELFTGAVCSHAQSTGRPSARGGQSA